MSVFPGRSIDVCERLGIRPHVTEVPAVSMTFARVLLLEISGEFRRWIPFGE